MKRISYVSSTATVILLLIVAALAGCGGNGTASNGENVPAQSAEKGAAGENQKIDGCSLVTQQDASKIMGKEAEKDESGNVVVDPAMLGECLWSYEYQLGSELIQFRVWGSDAYYSQTPGSQSLDIGDKGSIAVSKAVGVDIEWVQGGKSYTLSYFTTGPDAPDATAKVEEMKALAKKVSGQL